METMFPEDAGFAGAFLIGFRKFPDGSATTQRTGTAVLKRTYTIDPSDGTLTPADEAIPVFNEDVPDNLVVNGDFSSSQKTLGESEDEIAPGAWTAEGDAVAVLAPREGLENGEDPEEDGDIALQVTGEADSCVVQTIEFEEPLGGRSFTLSFWAKADVNGTQINDVRLEAYGASLICVCDIDQSLDIAMTSRYDATGTWPADLEATEMRVVLRMATNSSRTVYYDNVQVEERLLLTKPPTNALFYEHDMVPFKSEGDVIVLGFADIAGTNRVRVNGDSWLQRTVSVNGSGQDKAMFGWEPRLGVPAIREGQAGTFSDNGDDYPPEWPGPPANRDPLPSDFSNLFYNAYDRNAATTAVKPAAYLEPGVPVVIERGVDPSNNYSLTLSSEAVSAVYYFHDGSRPDEEARWPSQPVPMNLDTLVIEPADNRCYLVWRGAWNFDERPEDAYRRLIVEAS